VSQGGWNGVLVVWEVVVMGVSIWCPGLGFPTVDGDHCRVIADWVATGKTLGPYGEIVRDLMLSGF
jgi:hypothetical protein